MARLRREAQVLAALDHPGICRVLDWLDAQGAHYIVMEYVHGESLKLGVAWNARAPLQGLAGSQLGVCTLAYTAPEQLDRHDWPDARADVWSLGVTLFELLRGTRPFHAESVHELVEEIRNRHLPRTRAGDGLRRDDVHAVLGMALAKDPARRYPSALALADDLERLGRGEPVRARRQGVLERIWVQARRRPRLVSGGGRVWFSIGGRGRRAASPSDTGRRVLTTHSRTSVGRRASTAS